MAISVIMSVTLAVAAACLSSASCLPIDRPLQQAHELRKLGCEPKATVERIADYLECHDELADELYFPEFVAVKRWLSSSTFCGNPRKGYRTGQCQPDPQSIVQRPALVFYFKGREKRFQEVLVPEHTACMCT
ncbi:uncharacterized protein LOC127004723 [Eriocheir sinensis]|uniref:uncharacterized protein LOC127004723 n=1 Tax=Eriocheir sinensis TaxID=95602 RepID=UPI0021C6CDBA|nr:uncharacterized protein LOC127004723 [Eriocheir sinensis]